MLMWVILAMAIVTILPRLTPVFVLQRLVLPSWASRWLRSVPYAVLGALIFPGILGVDPARPILGVLGGCAAFILAYQGGHVFFVVVGAIATVVVAGVFM